MAAKEAFIGREPVSPRSVGVMGRRKVGAQRVGARAGNVHGAPRKGGREDGGREALLAAASLGLSLSGSLWDENSRVCFQFL